MIYGFCPVFPPPRGYSGSAHDPPTTTSARELMRSQPSEAGRANSQAMTAIVVLLVLAAFFVYRIERQMPRRGRASGRPRWSPDFPEMTDKPKAKQAVFKGCPSEGDGGDPVLNRLKNRVDEANEYRPIPFENVLGLPWPAGVERKVRDRWTAAETEEVRRYEGIPVSIEGFVAGARKEGEESCNCHGADDDQRDFHVWLTQNANEDRGRSIVVEVTPRLRFKHPAWTTEALGEISRDARRVMISGWLMLDPEHPDQVGRTRGTIWEIHPITKIEVEQNGRWVSLDSLASEP